ncbi:glycosyltransferase family 2 protein [Alloalcanivorax mobilis]|uniref:glycosyltransferase family 2 protein n=1 Tax=Alloalcanivorax mobilis TaxID=2019569 RepID=UPI000C757D34|nr:glycosyltransferase family 2 protein [Alloalcanivorax mobilis]
MEAGFGFSVVIPAYNYGYCLERAVLSALDQDDGALEVIVIDDGSTDNTDQVMATLAERHGHRLTLLRQHNQGQAAVRNRGVVVSRYPWLIFLDADDELLPGALIALRHAIRENPPSRLVIGGYQVEEHEVVKRREPGPVTDNPADNLSAFLNKRLNICNGACALHRGLFTTVRYEPGLRHTEDIPFFARVLAHYPTTGIDTPLARIHKHPDSLRHDLTAALRVGMDLEASIFDHALPPWAAALRRPYRAHRALSLLKLAHRQHRPDLVRHYFRIALRADFRKALRPRFLRRYVYSFIAAGDAGAMFRSND